jgi:hypothetical protein
MRKHQVNSRGVARLVGVAAQTVRAWRCGLRPTPIYAIRILKLTHE